MELEDGFCLSPPVANVLLLLLVQLEADQGYGQDTRKVADQRHEAGSKDLLLHLLLLGRHILQVTLQSIYCNQ